MNYHCECCDYQTSNKKDFSKHEMTAKHKKGILMRKQVNKSLLKYHCECCDYFTSKKTNYNAHCLTTKHKKGILIGQNEKKSYVEPTVTIGSLIPPDYNLVAELLKQNNELQKQIIEMYKMTTNNTVNTTNNTNNSNNTTNNQQFNLNFFLNETCKDAINFTEFINSIQVTDDDLENNVKMGFVNGMTKIIVDNLKQLTQNERPIHCTDVKRETIYVKEEDQWDKENSNKIIQKGIQNITCKNMQQLCQWREENPEYRDFESNLSDFSDAMQQHSMAGTKRDDFYPKIIKNIAKETTINEKTLK